MAESPPPITVIGLPEKKNPSKVAQEETPWPISACSLGSPSQRAEAPLAMMSVRACNVLPPPKSSLKGRCVKSAWTSVTGHELRSKPGCLLAHVLNQLRTLNALWKAGKFSTSVVSGQLPAGSSLQSLAA